MRHLTLAIAAIAAALAPGIARAQSVPQNWQALTKADVQAAYELLRANHPAASPELSDAGFQRALNDGYKLALDRAGQASSFDGYAATLAGFAQSFGDKHIWSRLNYLPNSLRWAGLIIGKRGSHWTVIGADADEASFKGADLVSCDGKLVDVLGRERIGSFRAYWPIEAQRVQAAPWLLIDNGNPFLSSPKICEFTSGGSTRTLTLKWREVGRANLLPSLGAAIGLGQAGYGVRSFAGGTWISLQGLEDKAPAVLEEVRRQSGKISQSQLVVVDLRGNGGGNSDYGLQLAEMLLGPTYLNSVLKQAKEESCPKVWRVSPDNIKTLEEYKVQFTPTMGPDYPREMTELITASKKALAEGKSFSEPTECAKSGMSKEVTKRPRWPAAFKLVLLTDAACFSSCLSVTDIFRGLGAIHVGQTTDAATRYLEVREAQLPSGLSRFSTLQAAALSLPPAFGPFTPDHIYDGDIADTAGVERWVVSTLGK